MFDMVVQAWIYQKGNHIARIDHVRVATAPQKGDRIRGHGYTFFIHFTEQGQVYYMRRSEYGKRILGCMTLAEWRAGWTEEMAK